jgi:hypothetical protein
MLVPFVLWSCSSNFILFSSSFLFNENISNYVLISSFIILFYYSFSQILKISPPMFVSVSELPSTLFTIYCQMIIPEQLQRGRTSALFKPVLLFYACEKVQRVLKLPCVRKNLKESRRYRLWSSGLWHHLVFRGGQPSFGGTCRLHLQGEVPEDYGGTFLWNTGNNLQVHTASQPGRPQSISSSPWELQTSDTKEGRYIDRLTVW